MSKDQNPPQPELIPEPPPASEKSDYKPATEDITSENLDLVENFIGSIYGEAKRIDQANIGDNQFTKGVKLDAHKEIVNLRNSVNNTPTNNQTPPPPPPQPVQPKGPSSSIEEHPMYQAVHNNIVDNRSIPMGDSLILKHEVDQLKEQLKDIKKLYDEFFKLKMVKGKWKITCEGKTQNTSTISKTWNVLNKMLKNKSKSINIEYIDDE